MTVIHDACALLTPATPRTSSVNSKGSNGAAEQAEQFFEGMARTLHLDLLGKQTLQWAMICRSSSMKYAAWLLSRRRMHDSSKNPPNHLCFSVAERVMWKDPTLQPAKLEWGCGLCWRSETSEARLFGTRVCVVVARTIRRLPTSEREDSNLVVTMRGTPVAGRPADAAAGRTPL